MLAIEKHLSKFADYCGLKTGGERGCDPMEEFSAKIDAATGGATPLADVLLYDSFDDDSGLAFHKDGSCGFFFEISPLVGSSAGLEKNLTLFFNDELPEGGYLQFLIIAGHDTSSILDMWESGRTCGGPFLERITAYRRDFIEKCGRDFENAGDGRLARNFRTFVTYSTNDSGTEKGLKKIIKFKRKLENKLRAEKFSPVLCKADDLLQINREIMQMDINLDGATKPARHNMARHDILNSLSNQMLSPLSPVRIEEEQINHLATGLVTKVFHPSELPESFSLSRMISLLGEGDKTVPARFIISYTIANNLGASGTSAMKDQGNRSIHASEMSYTRNDLVAREEARDWREVLAIHKKGEQFLTESMQVSITAPKEEIEIAEEVLKSLWNAQDWKLAISGNIQLLGMLSMLPMMQASYYQSLKFFKLTRVAMSGEVVAKLPLQGEWKGVWKSGVLLMGRRGQLFCWNPFERVGGGGNYNCTIVAPSGAGKSFNLAETATSMIAQDVAMFIMDIGGSY
ncbi:MAG: conjugal transfer protein TraC, partial [Rickettsiales bacterium]